MKICRFCEGHEVIRVFFGWDARTRTFEVLARPREVRCVCVGGPL